MINPMDLTGKRILITGASSGIGRQCAIVAANLGASVILVARRKEVLENIAAILEKNDHLIYSSDLSIPEEIEKLFEWLATKDLRLNGLVHAAGVAPILPLRISKAKDLQGVMNLNFGAFLELVRNFSKKKFLGENPSVVGISSVMASVGQPGRILYSASKGALDSAVRSMSLELAASGIRVNAVAPGVVNTELMQKTAKEMGDEWIQKQIIEQPLGMLDTLDVAHVVMFLLSDATLKVTGSVWAVDAGYTAR